MPPVIRDMRDIPRTPGDYGHVSVGVMATSEGDKDVMSELMKIPLLYPPFNIRVQELFFCYTEAYTNP